MTVRLLSLVVIYLCFRDGVTLNDTQLACEQDGRHGACVSLRDCASALPDPNDNKICGFGSDGEPVVCCVDRSANNFQATPAPIRVARSARYVPEPQEYMDTRPGAGGCAPLEPSRTAPRNGRKAWDKCIEYQEQLVYPCKKGTDYLGRLSRHDNCHHNVDELIVGGVDAKKYEFPHMALLGFGEYEDSAEYDCGGTVVGERFVLTAAHCTLSKAREVSFVKVGLLQRSEQLPASRVHRVKRIHNHPKYTPTQRYHDIALIETDTPFVFDDTTVPACVHTGEAVDDARASITGWGLTDNLGKKADQLQKVTIMKFPSDSCAEKFEDDLKLRQGYDDKTQLCYGHMTEKKDTCQADSGGPLQVHHPRIHCMYTVIGVTSFGKNCGEVGQPALYTRVAAYANWIESIVWP